MRRLRSCLIISMVIWLAGCASLPNETQEQLSEIIVDLPEPERQGVYHKMRKGQTLWRIAQAYDVPLKDIVETNNIPDVAQVEVNQLIFIPGVYEVIEMIPDIEIKDDGFAWPVRGKVIGYFRDRKGSLINKGIDIKVDNDETVKASRGGEVVFADELTGHGHMVILKHPDDYYSVYAQNAKLLTKLGDRVPKGAPIAKAGNQNRMSYLHFQIRKNGIEDNPLYYLP